MDRSEILDKVRSVVAETLELDEADVTEQTDLKKLGADSFDLLELVTALEDEFGLQVADDALESLDTVGDVVTAIQNAK